MSRFTRFTLVKRKSKAIGLKISTKAVNEMAREDITTTYKYSEGSKLERLSFERAYAHGARPKYQNGQILDFDSKDEKNNKYQLEISFEANQTESKFIGQDFDFDIFLKNYTSKNIEDADLEVIIYTITDNMQNQHLIKKNRIFLGLDRCSSDLFLGSQ